ncbi:MAG: peptidoglycan editing factor PgeF [Gammaproteobacteria bacterium]|nr:peptidoglycan editing factor PgeF [Gammaproteobacteria bacterium]MBU1623549.1 peptidoglycan editing factor PgeF [Gammaproteobacteria bacterium]
MKSFDPYITPDWPAPANVRALQTTRTGGVSGAPYDSMNLGLHVGDDPLRVNHNRQSLSALLPTEPVWLEQIHGTEVANADAAACRVVADASIARHRGSVCVVMTADCLPVLLCDEDGTVVGAAHAGWRGLCDGVIEATVKEMGVAPHKLMAWLGPAIGQAAFEVGEEVREAFISQHAQAKEAFIARGQQGKYHADIYLLARQRLHALGVDRVYGGDYCTYHQEVAFFSYRRDGVTGRMGTFIWLA